jgi:hypothetical protein
MQRIVAFVFFYTLVRAPQADPPHHRASDYPALAATRMASSSQVSTSAVCSASICLASLRRFVWISPRNVSITVASELIGTNYLSRVSRRTTIARSAITSCGPTSRRSIALYDHRAAATPMHTFSPIIFGYHLI